MRLVIRLIGVVVFLAMLLIDPVALGRLGYACATGGCGVRPGRLAAGAAGLVALVWLWRAARRRAAAPAASARARKAAPARARRAAPAVAARPRATPAARRPRRKS